MPTKGSKGSATRARATGASAPHKNTRGSASPQDNKGGKRKGGGKGNAKGELAIRATNYVAGDYMATHETADPRYVWDKRKRRNVERELPEGLSKRDRKVLTKVRKRARCLDYGLNICGLRFGPSALIGFIPVVGDLADLVLGVLLVIRKARQADIPKKLTAKMLYNHAVSEVVGLIPFLGDIFIAWWKANSRNAWLLEAFLIDRALQTLGVEIEENEEILEEAEEEEEVEN